MLGTMPPRNGYLQTVCCPRLPNGRQKLPERRNRGDGQTGEPILAEVTMLFGLQLTQDATHADSRTEL